jgi:RNA polymerase sigma-70 factor (ECF subfamily)
MDDLQARAAVLKGDVDAFRHIVARYHRRLYYFVSGKVANQSLVEDLVQKSMVTAFQRLSDFDPHCEFEPWLRGIAINHCRDTWKQQARQAQLQERLLQMRRAEMQLDLLDDAVFSDERRAAALRQCVEALSETEQQAVQMRFVEERGLHEISSAIGKDAQALRFQLYRLRQRLAVCVRKRLALMPARAGGAGEAL